MILDTDKFIFIGYQVIQKKLFQSATESVIALLVGVARNLRGRGKKLSCETDAISLQQIFV